MGTLAPATGHYSILRWRLDATRDEAKNVAVVLVADHGGFGGVKHAPLSAVSSRLHEQGILDRMLVGLEQRFEGEGRPRLDDLREMHEKLTMSLYLTAPKAVMVADPDATLSALYKAYVAPRGGGGGKLTKGVVLDRVISAFRRQGAKVERGTYFKDFLFDAVIERTDTAAPIRTAAEVLSFATPSATWAPVEHDAGHFLYAVDRVGLPAIAVICPPTETSHPRATEAHERVMRWYKGAGVAVHAYEDVTRGQFGLAL